MLALRRDQVLSSPLLERIVSFFDPTELLTASATSHAFHRACQSEVAWNNSEWFVSLEDVVGWYNRRHVFERSMQRLQHLHIQAQIHHDVPPPPLKLYGLKSMTHVSRLEYVDWRNYNRLETLVPAYTDVTLKTWLELAKMPSLRYLKLRGCRLSASDFNTFAYQSMHFRRRLGSSPTLHVGLQEVFSQFTTEDWQDVLTAIHWVDSVRCTIELEVIEAIIKTEPQFFSEQPKHSCLRKLSVRIDAKREHETGEAMLQLARFYNLSELIIRDPSHRRPHGESLIVYCRENNILLTRDDTF